ncbi:hypothetical protein JW859_12125 [bacterium]|nr:hypothetical protein [bacterium]
MQSSAETQQILYGANTDPGLVGIVPTESGVALWTRNDGAVVREEQEYRPSIITAHPHLLDDFKPDVQITPLRGDHLYAYRATCENWAHQDAALKHLSSYYRQHRAEFEFEPYLRFTDPVNQYLLESGRTHFKQLDLQDVRVVYLAVRTLAPEGAEYADPHEAGDRILLIGLADGHQQSEVLRLVDENEKGLLLQLNERLLELDPDVIVGHNAFKGALNYIQVRAKRHRVKLVWGRDGSVVKVRKSRAPAAEKQLEYPRMDIGGRSVVDTWFLAHYYDIVKRDLLGFDAPTVARHLDETCQVPDALPVWEIERYWRDKPNVLVADIQYELQATQAIFSLLAGSYFAQAQLLPMTLQDSVVRGNGVKINHLLLREYLRRGESIPEPADARTFIGGYTEIRQTGVLHNVLNVDVASLYPSIMVSHAVKPDSDTGGVFQPLLRELTAQRLEAKRVLKASKDNVERVRADARQAAFKIFINSFFGYLGTNRMNWADPLKAEYITTTGQQIVRGLADLIEREQGKIIEIDTDGVYFTAPPGYSSADDRERLVKKINKELPTGITIELGGYYPAMLSYKVKNYALLSEDGSVTIRGSGLRSRGLEPYLNRYIAQCLRAILLGQTEVIDEMARALEDRIKSGTIGIRELAKTETLIESLDTYKEKVEAGSRNRAAAYEIALRASRPLHPGDQVSYYITGDSANVKAYESANPLSTFTALTSDYNKGYYIKKLNNSRKRLEVLFSD